MRLTGGDARGRRLKGPRGANLRPTSDRVREAAFDILGARVRGAAFLDAFAGTGAVGIEALSRGAGRVVFLERDRRAVALIRDNLKLGAWPGATEVIAADAGGALRALARRGEKFGIVFLDPPYDHPALEGLLQAALPILEPAGLIMIEHRSATPCAPPEDGGLRLVRSYRHGDTSLTTFAATSGR